MTGNGCKACNADISLANDPPELQWCNNCFNKYSKGENMRLELETLKNLLDPKSLTFVLGEIAIERERQDIKWGEQNNPLGIWRFVLGEELGEADKDILEAWAARQKDKRELAEQLLQAGRYELIQAAAVIIATIEYMDRKGKAIQI